MVIGGEDLRDAKIGCDDDADRVRKAPILVRHFPEQRQPIF